MAPPRLASTDSASQPQQPSAGRRYQCPTCFKSFKRREHQLRHVRSHTQEKPYPCKYCPSRFGRKDLVTRHQKTLHADQYQQDEVSAAAETTTEATSPHGSSRPEQSSPSNDTTAGPGVPVLDPSLFAIDPSLSHPASTGTPYYHQQSHGLPMPELQPPTVDRDSILPNDHGSFGMGAVDDPAAQHQNLIKHESSQFG